MIELLEEGGGKADAATRGTAPPLRHAVGRAVGRLDSVRIRDRVRISDRVRDRVRVRVRVRLSL